MPQRRVFVSESFAVLQEALATAVKAVKDANPLASVTVITSGAPLALRLRRMIARTGRGYFGLRTCTLADFAREVAEDTLLQEGKRPLPPLAAPPLVKRLLNEAGSDNYFSPLASLPGFPYTFLATLADFKHAGVSPQLLRNFLDRAPQGDISRRKLASLCFLYERYTRFLTEQGFYDADTITERAVELLEADPPAAPLFLYGFYDFTPLQRRLIAAAVTGCDALVFFPWRAGEAYAHATPTLTWLTNLGFQTVPLAVDHEREDNLTRLQAGLFEERSSARAFSPHKTDQSVLFLSAPGESQEAREIGRIILEFARAHGVRFHEIGVFLREPAAYGQLLVETFQGLGIPSFLYGGLPLIRTQAGQRLLLLWRMLLADYARSSVIEFVYGAEPPFAFLLGEQAEYARPARWETFSMQAGLVKGASEWRERLARLFIDLQKTESEETGPSDQQTLRVFISFMEGFLAASEPRPQADSWRGWTDFILRLMRSYIGPTEYTSEVEEALLSLTELTFLGDPISFEEWVRGATAGLKAATVPVGALDGGGVFIGDLLAARGLQFRAVIIPGLVDGTFPRLARQDPLLLDQERQYLSEFLLCELRQRRNLSEAEQLLFVLAVHSARERVVLSYPRAEHGSGPVRAPSFYLLRALETLSGAPASFIDLRKWERRAPLLPVTLGPPSEAMDQIEYHLLSAGHAIASRDPASLGYLSAASPFFTSALHATRQRWNAERLTVFDGMIEDEVVRVKVRQRLFPAGLRLSASALEIYARCPFRYFLSTVLGLNQSEAPERVLTLQPRDRGALLHDILHDFFTRVREAGQLPLAHEDKTALRRLLQQVAEEHFLTFAHRSATGFSLLWEIEQERLLGRLMGFLDRECDAGEEFLPAAFEVRFGTAASGRGRGDTPLFFSASPARLELHDGETIALHGRIDRIDLSVDRRRARIMDYKTGKPIRGRFAGGMALQLPLYLYAARVLWPETVWESAAYAYVDHESKAEPPLFTAADWESSLTALQEVVAKLTQSLCAGCFAATPDTCSPCPFPVICGGQAGRRAARKQHDPRLAPLLQVRAIE